MYTCVSRLHLVNWLESVPILRAGHPSTGSGDELREEVQQGAACCGGWLPQEYSWE